MNVHKVKIKVIVSTQAITKTSETGYAQDILTAGTSPKRQKLVQCSQGALKLA